MTLNEALEYAVVLGWPDFLKVTTPSLARIEYESEPGATLDHLTVWLIKRNGEQDRAFEYWARASWGYAAGPRFANGHDSKSLTRALDFVLQNHEQFQHLSDCRKGRILVYPPTEIEATTASTWWRGAAVAVASRKQKPVSESQSADCDPWSTLYSLGETMRKHEISPDYLTMGSSPTHALEDGRREAQIGGVRMRDEGCPNELAANFDRTYRCGE